MIADLDSDGSGEIDGQEFAKIWNLTKSLTEYEIDEGRRAASDQIAELFAHHDEDGSGSISSEEFSALFSQLKVVEAASGPTRSGLPLARTVHAGPLCGMRTDAVADASAHGMMPGFGC